MNFYHKYFFLYIYWTLSPKRIIEGIARLEVIIETPPHVKIEFWMIIIKIKIIFYERNVINQSIIIFKVVVRKTLNSLIFN
jgi:hypothetical protein